MRVLKIASLYILLLGASPAMADCSADIAAVANRANTFGPYRVTTTVSLPDRTYRSYVAMVPPDAMQVRNEVDGIVSEMVIIGENAWVAQDGAWSPLPAEYAAQFSQQLAATLLPEIISLINPQCHGPVHIDGAEYLRYSFGYAENGAQTRSTLLVTPQTGLPARMTIDASEGRKFGTVETTYQYDASITITPPM